MRQQQPARWPRVLTSCTGILVIVLLLGMAAVAWADRHKDGIGLALLAGAGLWSLAAWLRQRRR